MYMLPIIALIGVLAAKELVRAHHRRPRPWERGLTALAFGLGTLAAALLVLRAQQLIQT